MTELLERVLGEMVQVLLATGAWGQALAVLVGGAILLLLVKKWALFPPVPPTDEQGLPQGSGSKPMDMPEGGLPLDQKPPEDWS